VRPVEGNDASVVALNRQILNRIGDTDEIGYLALPCGTAVKAEAALLRALRAGQRPDGPNLARWFDFLVADGAGSVSGE
jgi:hypothetical protein